MRFLNDAQLPPALARWLAGEGHEAEHVADRQMEAASDEAIWDFALRASAAIITKDEDFAQSAGVLHLASEFRACSRRYWSSVAASQEKAERS
jgi:predicted nuclease of predicted toxin-antitoxin system